MRATQKHLNEIERIVALAAAGPAIRMMRDGGTSWDDIATKQRKTCNPLGLSARQLSRIYEGPNRYTFDLLRKVAKSL